MDIPKLKKDAIVYINSDFRAKRCLRCGKGEMHVIMNFGANAPPFHKIFNLLKNNELEWNCSLTR